jgi:hypothetical protein
LDNGLANLEKLTKSNAALKADIDGKATNSQTIAVPRAGSFCRIHSAGRNV